MALYADAIHRLSDAQNAECPFECLSKENLYYVLELLACFRIDTL